VGNPEDEKIDPCFMTTTGSKAAADQSCATVYPPQGPERPSLSATWENGINANVFNIAVKATGAAPDDVVLLVVTNAKEGSGGKVFFRSMVSGTGTGAVEASAKVPVKNTENTVCVVASTISGGDDKALRNMSKAGACVRKSFDLRQTSFAVFKNLP
jgi:hypothetical protein